MRALTRGWRISGLVAVVAAAALAAAVTVRSSGDNEGAAPTPAPFVRSDSKRSATAWAVGDGANGDAVSRRLARQIRRTRPDRFLYLGDVYEDGTREEFARNYEPVYGALNSITAPAPGNHEWPNHEEGYDEYWREAGRQLREHWYRFETAGWEILSLNSEDVSEQQTRWLTRQVRERGTCRLAFMHRAYLSAGRHGDQKDLSPIWNALRGRAAIMLGAHDHNMQRFKRRDGLVQLVSGAGGDGFYESDENDPRLAWDEDDEYGALSLDLRPGVASFRFVAINGRTLDSGRIRCRPVAS